ncbi:hypothetical protein ACIHCM_08985 [Streptomyces sp. NPDC052023]|uniref:hypothetical protein n=1 Tax=Streptomyces sp. NPDC052023 TaxID=3365681 RepID=UPI0037D3346B
MTTSTSDKPVVRRLETGWSKARRLRAKSELRTWLPAVESPDGPRTSHTTPEWNIVRGED